MEKNNISALEEQFIQECKLINLNYEYPGYTGEEKWAIISDLTEEDIMRKYAELIQPYSPFLLLNSSFGEIPMLKQKSVKFRLSINSRPEVS